MRLAGGSAQSREGQSAHAGDVSSYGQLSLQCFGEHQGGQATQHGGHSRRYLKLLPDGMACAAVHTKAGVLTAGVKGANSKKGL